MPAWKAEYSLGVKSIDEQHEELFRMLNDLGDALWEGVGKDKIRSTLKFLANYTVDHFKTEERFMQESSYPGFEEHKKAHDGFVEEVTQFINQYETEDLALSVTIGVFNRLGDWTRDHVRGLDQEMGEFLTSPS